MEFFKGISITGRLCYLFMCIERYLVSMYPDRDWTPIAERLWQWTENYWNDAQDASDQIIPEYLMEFDTYEETNTVYSCPLKYMSVDMFGRLVNKSVSIMLERVKDSDDLLDKLIEACAKIVLGYEDNAFMSRIKEIQAIGQEEIKKTYRRD